jgi:polyisoprenoid-binding protein YceI
MTTATISDEPTLRAGAWNIDAARSGVRFAVKHMVVGTTRGGFSGFRGELEIRPSGDVAASGTVDAESIDTGDSRRDEHLRGADFFDVAHHPEIAFVSTEAQLDRAGAVRVTGNLTIRGETRTVHLAGSVLPTLRDPLGRERLALTLTGKIDRAAFGVGDRQRLAGGGLAIDRRVTLALDLSAVRRAVEASA